jgi:hypothetical protein
LRRSDQSFEVSRRFLGCPEIPSYGEQMGNAGSSSKLIPTKGATYEAGDGTVGEIRSFHELDRVRLT